MKQHCTRLSCVLAFCSLGIAAFPALAGFVKSDGIDFGEVIIGQSRQDQYIRVCHDTYMVQTVSVFAALDTWGGTQSTRGPFKLAGTSYNLTGSFKGFPPYWHGECHSFYVFFTPSTEGRSCTMVYFYYTGGGDSRNDQRMVCGTGIVPPNSWLPAVLNLMLE